MQAIQALKNAFRLPKQVLAAENPFAAPDRATLCTMRRQAEQIDTARRFWACPFYSSIRKAVAAQPPQSLPRNSNVQERVRLRTASGSPSRPSESTCRWR